MAHLLAWQEVALAVATELAVNETSPAKEPGGRRTGTPAAARSSTPRSTRAGRRSRWTSCASGSRSVPGQLRGYLTVVPESRWLKHADHQRFFLHRDDRALRGARGRPRGDPRRGGPMTLRDAPDGCRRRPDPDRGGPVARRRGHLVARRPSVRGGRRPTVRRPSSRSIPWSPRPRSGRRTRRRRRADRAGSRSPRPSSTITPRTGRSPGSPRPTGASARATDAPGNQRPRSMTGVVVCRASAVSRRRPARTPRG